MSDDKNRWLTDESEILQSLISDESKNMAILIEQEKTIKQLKAKSGFRLALLNSLRESKHNK